MTQNEKNTLLALIDGLTKTENATQYDDGNRVIKDSNIELLKNFIKNM